MSWGFESILREYRKREVLADFVEVVIVLIFGAIILGSLWASAADDAPVLDVRRAVVELPDGGVVIVDGGVWLSDGIALARANDLVKTQAELDALRQQPLPQKSSAVIVVTNVLTALVHTAGALIGTCLATTGNALCQK